MPAHLDAWKKPDVIAAKMRKATRQSP